MSEIVNPYIAGAPVTEQRMFFGREDVFQWIENSIAGQYADHILVIHGQRRVGKTSVLKQLGNRLPKRFIPVFFDLQGRTHTSLDRFLWWLAREIVRVLKQERGIEVPLPEKESFTDTEYFENRFLPDLRPALGDGTLLLTFDEFDNLEESEVKEELARPLIDHLRRLMGNTGLNFIFSIGSSGRKLENMQAAYTDFFKTALYKKISFLTEEQTRSLISRPVENIIEYEKQSVTRIYQIAGGHPYFTQLTCHELFAKCQRTDQRIIKEADIDSVLEDVIERGTVNLKFVWDEASDMEKWGLSALAQLDKTDNRSLTDYLRKHRVRFSETDLTSGLLHLREKDIITSENRFVIYLLKLWLQKNRPIEQAREELTEVNPIANRYIEIGLEFKDSGMYDKAIESFQEALAVAKDNLQAQVNIALTYMDQKSYSNAIVEFEKALTMDDEDVSARSGLCEAHLSLGDTAMQKGRMKDAIQSYQRVLTINAEHTEARGRMSEIARQRAEKALADGRDEEALSAFAEAMKYTPEDPSLSARVDSVKVEKKAKVVAALVARSAKEAGAENWDGAVQALEEALRLSPEDASVQQKLVSVKSEQEKALLEGLLARANTAEKSARWNDAVDALKQYLSMKPDEAIQIRLESLRGKQRESQLISLRTQARGLAKSERYDDALKLWQEYLAMGPAEESIKNEISEVTKAQAIANSYAEAQKAYGRKNYDGAINLLKGIINQDENYKDASRLLAESIELRRTARKWWQAKWVWGGLAGLAILIIGWLAFRYVTPMLTAMQTTPTAGAALANPSGNPTAPSTVVAPAAPPTATAAPLPYTWVRVNSGQFLPRDTITAIVVDPNDAGVMYVGTENAGIYKSIDGGVSWQPVHNGLGRASIQTLVIDPTNPNILYAGTLMNGVYKTADGGQTWDAANNGIELPGWSQTGVIIMDKLDSLHLYYTHAWNIYETSDGGNNWRKLEHSGCPSWPVGLAIHPSNSQILYAMELAEINPECKLGVYKSQDGGRTWSLSKEISQGLSLAIDTQDGNHLYTSARGELYGSIDGGDTWNLVADSSCNVIAFAPQNEKIAYCGIGSEIEVTSDGGKTWQMVGSSGVDQKGQVASITVSVHDSQKIWVGSQSLLLSNDEGKSWTEHDNGLGASHLALKIDPGDNSTLYLEMSNGWLYRSSDAGRNWKLIEDRGSGLAFSASGVDLYRAQSLGFLLVSHDKGDNWNELSIPEAIFVGLDPQQPGTLFAVADQCNSDAPIYISKDDGQTWSEKSGYVPCDRTRVYFGAEQGKRVYLVGNGTLSRSDDGGETWERCGDTQNGTPARYGSRLTLDPRNDDHLYLATRFGGVIASSDGCRTWQSSNASLGSLFVNTIAIDPNNPDTIYAGTDGGAYISTDGGKTWGQVNDGLLGATVVYSIVVDEDDNVYAATPYGIFKLEAK